MKLDRKKLRKLILKEMFGGKNPGCAVLMYDDSDQIAAGFREVFGVKELPVKIPTGHSSCAIVSPSGKITGISFGPPVCKGSKAKGVIDKLGREIGKKIGFIGAMQVNVKSLGTCKLKNGKFTKSSAKVAAKALKARFHGGRKCFYYAYNDVDAQASLDYAGKDGRCKAYSPVPTFDAGTGIGADNCASFAIDVIATGKTDLGTSQAQMIASPAGACTAANIAFGGSDFKGSV